MIASRSLLGPPRARNKGDEDDAKGTEGGFKMVRLISVAFGFFGLCSAFGETPQEKRMLDSLVHKFLTDTEYAQGLHKTHSFFELPSIIDTGKVAFDKPLRTSWVKVDSTLVKSRKFKIKEITNPKKKWDVPFKYDGRYVGSFTIEPIEGEYCVSGFAADANLWEGVERRVEKDKAKGAQLVRFGNLRFLHFPAIDEYSLLPLFTYADFGMDTVSQAASSSPLKINTDLVRDQLKERIIDSHRKSGKRRKK
jgi:hypothetical protein